MTPLVYVLSLIHIYIMTMPGLPKVPAAVNIDVTDDGKITGLF